MASTFLTSAHGFKQRAKQSLVKTNSTEECKVLQAVEASESFHGTYNYGAIKGSPPLENVYDISRAFILFLGTVPAGTCSRNMFSVHTISSSMNDVLKRIVPARTVPAGTWSNHVLGTNRPLSTHPKQV